VVSYMCVCACVCVCVVWRCEECRVGRSFPEVHLGRPKHDVVPVMIGSPRRYHRAETQIYAPALAWGLKVWRTCILLDGLTHDTTLFV